MGDRVVKVELREEDVDTLDKRARDRGLPRLFILREIIENHLKGTEGTSSAPNADTIRAAVLEERTRGYEALIEELKANKTHNEGIIQQLMAEQNRLITDGKHWWQWWK
jgi:predicted DNA-binding protein